MVDYNPFAKDFAASRKNMKWEEISYFLNFFKKESQYKNQERILDIGCGSGRLLEQIREEGFFYETYLWLDRSQGLIEEAKKNFPDVDFLVSDMLYWDKIQGRYSIIFFIASFHHLENYEQRKKALEIYTQKLLPGGYICMTNWALESRKNKERYQASRQENSQNQYGSTDFSIKFWEYERYYHSFSLTELEKLANDVWLLNIVENREFDTENNIVSVFQKK